ncbi:hypothetical protein F5J12DRAFT_722460 [Pisolithus orientalis]|uniref:uncharacterized protein n=1 Tax=Pisolithus orientalis TaxID=936130 RepID=UPI002224B58C|nr:uncharacterized protein F5J12DRAFT_722460 [Pisolithus orientalis]KAI6003496.1 hypothetical protein F5J12DRAFT_722460 [Pisolithus orientalis]
MILLFVGQLQCTLLDIHTILNFIKVLHPLLLNPPSCPVCINLIWMGCFIKDTQVCESLYFVGVPVWLYCREAFIPPTMNIVQLVWITYANHIVKAMYTENGIAKPFQILPYLL